MNFTNRQLFIMLREFMTDEEIYLGCELSKDRFMENLEKDENGIRDQPVIKQYHMLISLIPIHTLYDVIQLQNKPSDF